MTRPDGGSPLSSAGAQARNGWIKRRGPIVLGLAISLALAFLAFRRVSLSEVADTIAGVRLRWVPAMVAVIFGDFLIRSLRWQLLLSSAAPQAGVWQLVRLEAIGLAVNNVVFLRIGEVARAVVAGRELQIPLLTALATIFVERVLDMITLVFLFGVAARLEPRLVPGMFSHTAFAAVAGLAAVLAALAFADGNLRERQTWRWLARHPRALTLVEQASLGARPLRSGPLAVRVVALGFALWLMDTLLYWTGGRAIGLTPELGYGRSLLVLSSAAASSFLPAVPGSFGTFEAAVQAFLTHLGVPQAAALGYAGFVHLVNYLVVTVLGIFFLYRTGFTLAHLKTLQDG